jgi:hypothetical protein
MLRKSLVCGAVGAITLVGFLAAVVDTAEAQRGPRCRGMVTGDEAKGQIRFFTEGKARRSWSSKVTRRYSAEYASWGLAQERRMNCRKRMPGRTWHCTAQGIACNRAP